MKAGPRRLQPPCFCGQCKTCTRNERRLKLLTEMIQKGWGDIPQNRIPRDWRRIEPPSATISQ
jgi:hypothetical protein